MIICDSRLPIRTSAKSYRVSCVNLVILDGPCVVHVLLSIFNDNRALAQHSNQSINQEIRRMATAKNAASKAAPTPAKVVAPAKAAQPAAKKAPISKTAKEIAKLSASIAKLTERKDKVNEEIKVLRDQRAALKATPTAPAVAPAPVAKPVKKAAAPKAAAKAVAPKAEAPKPNAAKKATKPAAKK